MDLTAHPELNVSFSLDTVTNITTVDIKDGSSVSLGTIEIENVKLRPLLKALAFLGEERIVNSQFQGQWNANLNVPFLSDTEMGPAPDIGDVYLVTTEGTRDLGSGEQTFYAGNWVIFDGFSWKRTYTDDASIAAKTSFNFQESTARIKFG